MKRIRFIPAQVKTSPDERPDACKHCGSQILTRHGAADKSVIDLYYEKVTTVRYRRFDCERTFRHYPEGIDRGRQTQRMRGWRSLRGRSAYRRAPRAAFRVSISRMSARHDVQESGRNARGKQARGAHRRTRVIGADETVVRLKGETTAVGVVTDAAADEVLDWTF